MPERFFRPPERIEVREGTEIERKKNRPNGSFNTYSSAGGKGKKGRKNRKKEEEKEKGKNPLPLRPGPFSLFLYFHRFGRKKGNGGGGVLFSRRMKRG